MSGSELLSGWAENMHPIEPHLQLFVLSLLKQLLHLRSVRNSINYTVYFEVYCVGSLAAVELILLAHAIAKLVESGLYFYMLFFDL